MANWKKAGIWVPCPTCRYSGRRACTYTFRKCPLCGCRHGCEVKIPGEGSGGGKGGRPRK